MCGIIFVQKKNDTAAAKAVIKRYDNQKSRGSEGFGAVSFNGGKLAAYVRAESEKEIMPLIKDLDGDVMLFHHRYPTSTVNVAEAAHPIKIERPEFGSVYYIVHNGIIYNADVLKAEHEKRGYKYTTTITTKWITTGKTYEAYEFNDSEALAWELAMLIEGVSDKINATGDYAFIVAQVSKAGQLQRLYYGTNGGNPLTMTEDNNIFALTSEGGKKSVEAGVLYSYDPRKRRSIALEANIGSVKKKEYGYGYATSSSGYLYEYPSRAERSEDEYEVLEEVSEMESEIAYLNEQLDAMRAEAAKTGNWEDYEEIRAQIKDLERDKEAIELEYAMK